MTASLGRILAATVVLVAVYALTLASVAPWDLALGALVALTVLTTFRPFLFPGRGLSLGDLARRGVAFVPFAVALTGDIVRGTWAVALVVLHVRPLAHPGIVAVPIAERSPLGVAVSGLATTLSPGAFLVDVNWEDRVMLIHVLDATDPDRVRADHQRFYRRWQRHVFP